MSEELAAKEWLAHKGYRVGRTKMEWVVDIWKHNCWKVVFQGAELIAFAKSKDWKGLTNDI